MAGVARLRQVAVLVACLAAASSGLDRLDPSLPLTADLRLTNLGLLVMLTLGCWLLALLVGRRWPRVPRAVAVPAALWLLALTLSAVHAPTYQSQALAFVRHLALGLAWGWAVYDLARYAGQQVLLARAFALGGTLVALLGLAEAVHVEPVGAWLAGFRYQASFSVGDVPRVSASLAHPNIAAMLLGLSLPLQVVWAATTTTRPPLGRLVLGACAAAQVATLVLTISRAGIAVTGLVLLGMLAAARWQRQVAVGRASLAAAVGLLGASAGLLVAEPVLRLHLADETAADWYRADYRPPPSLSLPPGQTTSVAVQLTNTSARPWLAGGAHPFALSYHLARADGSTFDYEGLRTPLPADVPPGGSVELQAQVAAPAVPGTYVLEWDELEESVTWFTWAGTPPGRTTLQVAGPSAGAGVAPPPAPPVAATSPPVGRLQQWRIALRMARNSPILGVGPDTFRWVYGDFAGTSVWDTGGHANSLYFEWLADTGLLGTALFGWLAVQLLRRASRGLRWLDDGSWPWRLGLLGSLAAWFLHSLVDYFYEPLGTNVAFWLLAALALAAATGAQPPQPSGRASPCASASM